MDLGRGKRNLTHIPIFYSGWIYCPAFPEPVTIKVSLVEYVLHVDIAIIPYLSPLAVVINPAYMLPGSVIINTGHVCKNRRNTEMSTPKELYHLSIWPSHARALRFSPRFFYGC